MNDFDLSRLKLDANSIASWQHYAPLLAALEHIGRRGVSVVIKVDGLRESGLFFTVVISGARSDGEFFRKDSGDIGALLHEAVTFYLKQMDPTPDT